MILDSLILLGTGFLWAILQVFLLITFAIPTQINTSIEYILSLFGHLKGVFPVDVAFQAFVVYLNFILLLYSWKIVKWVYAHLPWFGKHQPLPKLDGRSNK